MIRHTGAGRQRVITACATLALCLAPVTSSAAIDAGTADPGTDGAGSVPEPVGSEGPWGMVRAAAAPGTDGCADPEVPPPAYGHECAALLALAASWDPVLLASLSVGDDVTRVATMTAALGPSGPSGAVLLRNDGVLPLPTEATVTLVDAVREVAAQQDRGPSTATDRAAQPGVGPVVVLVRAERPAGEPPSDGSAAPAAPSADLPPPVPAPPAQPHEAEVPEAQAELVRQIAGANPRTVAVLLGPADVPTAAWDQDVAALVHLWDGDGLWQEPALDTHRLTALLQGESAPSGRLPVAMPDPRYPLGHGLTYTTFEYANLRPGTASATGPVGAVHDAVTVDVTNTGPAPGTETVQVYAGPSPTDGSTFGPSSLAGWAQVTLEPGQTQAVTVPLEEPALGATAHAVDGEPGRAELHVGASAADLRLDGTFDLGHATNEPTPADPPDTAAGAGDGAPGPGQTATGDASASSPSPTGADTASPAPVTTPRAVPLPTRPATSAPIGSLRLAVTPGSLVLTGAERLHDRLRLQGDLPTVMVQDSRQDRAGRGGWTVSGQFTDLSGNQHTLTADRLGWEPRVVTGTAGLTAGPSVTTSLSGGPGLANPAVLGSADARAASGSTILDATVRLEVPAGTPAGAYGGTVTLTLFPTE